MSITWLTPQGWVRACPKAGRGGGHSTLTSQRASKSLWSQWGQALQVKGVGGGKEERRGDQNALAMYWGSLRKETAGASQTTLGMHPPSHRCSLTSPDAQPWGWCLVVPVLQMPPVFRVWGLSWSVARRWAGEVRLPGVRERTKPFRVSDPRKKLIMHL